MLFVLILLLANCTNSEKALRNGNYDLAISKASKKLRKHPTKAKEVLVIEQAFNSAQQRDFDQIAFIKKEGTSEKWDNVFDTYTRIKVRQSIIKTLPPLTLQDDATNTTRAIHFNIIDVDNELIQSKQKAAEYFYVHALSLLQKGDRFNAREAYLEFQKVKSHYSNYRDIDAQLAKSHEAGTTKVFFRMKKESPIPLPPNFEEDLLKISMQDLNQNWIRYYTADPGNTNYDYTIFVNIKSIDVAPPMIKEIHYAESKQVPDGWEYIFDSKGNVKKDSLGNDMKKPKTKTITCNVIESRYKKMAHLVGCLDYFDNNTGQLFKTNNIAADSFFEDGIVTVLGGDVNALKPETKAKIGRRQPVFPNDFDMLLQAGATLKGMVKNILYENRCILQ